MQYDFSDEDDWDSKVATLVKGILIVNMPFAYIDFLLGIGHRCQVPKFTSAFPGPSPDTTPRKL